MSSTEVSPPRRIIIGISGASGFGYGVAALRMLRALQVESHLVISPAAQLNRCHETALTEEAVMALADVTYDIGNVGAAIASGSFPAAGMLIAPCSMHTLAAVATSLGSNLLTRAADVTLKERRRLVLMVREAPLHAGHLRNMLQVTESGGIIFPPVPAWYGRPTGSEEIIAHSVARALGLLGLPCQDLPRWGETHHLITGENHYDHRSLD
ncbi:UbiX family flavin prenyltransferase [Klebsiella sp. JB_Kp018]|uniref:UbiX family flavin prenyltransferase n=1 Tax=Klebsiella TaxID=570 RepID=UPI002ABC9B1F|nr:UbiX family flavin prenyltransferase [Klebsiella variicola]HBQ3196550.1 UbiX family flavin prenyltransferase [Klebsiella variicola subsp. variicola]MDZ0575023.1 UbiX family flavin prenyltransferase [Klebsiella variicola]HBR0978840.1 UbiX family flavin prenyltransferase [Klebsiella variicola]HBR2026702.1 UbiX family flavin prenyltransferase [Klebsiella variicola]HBR2064551.1 UbiX family flavin prenyltransferase [Klebsiella variicola]